jgi:hypothetical protein
LTSRPVERNIGVKDGGRMLRSRIMSVYCSLVGGLALVGCGGGSGVSLVPASSNPQQNVMVIDEGFDLSVSDLRGRVAAAYTEACADEPAVGADAAASADAGNADAGGSFDQMKQALLMALSTPDDSCHLTTGIGAKSDPLPSIAQFRGRWNAMIQANDVASDRFTPTEVTALMTALQAPDFQAFPYHGTSTASTAAHENPNVRLVLVERQLESEAAAQSGFTCFVQSDIDEAVQLFSDPQVYAAWINQPAQLDGDIAAAQTRYDVGLVNESFGSSSRQGLEMLQATNNCPTPVDLSAYFTLLDKAGLAHAATIGGPPVLTVQAAGNEGVEIDSGADSLSCDLGDPRSLLAGSTDPLQVRSTFSDFGACVDVYAPGESIVARYAGDWLIPVDGTSFSSPIVVRQISLAAPAPMPFDPAQARTALLAQRASDGSLPIGLFPVDFFYLPDQSPVAALRAGLPWRRVGPRPVSRADLHRVLHPLSLLRSLRRR